MTSETINISKENSEASATSVVLCNASGTFGDGPRRVPIAIPRDQAYFWTSPWQSGERKADKDLAEGDTKRFSNDDIDGMLDWLRSDD